VCWGSSLAQWWAGGDYPGGWLCDPSGGHCHRRDCCPISYYAIRFRQRRNLDESLDVWACHGMGGTWGAVATGIFASEAGTSGLLTGNPGQFLVQLLTIGIVIIFSFGVTFVISKLLDRFVGLRVTDNEEEVGLDISEHGERAYA
jgi:ammonium transporter, Amt family